MVYQFQPVENCYFLYDDNGAFLQSCDVGELAEYMEAEEREGAGNWS